MQFKRNAPVYTADQHQVGVIDRVVLDPQTNDVSHLVIRQGWFFTEDKVVPIELVDVTTAEQIQLRSDVKNLDHLPRFEEISYIPSTDDTDSSAIGTSTPEKTQITTEGGATETVVITDDDENSTTTYTTMTDAFALYGYPPIGLTWPEYGLGYYGYPDELYKVKVKRHIPAGTVALREGATVVDSQGERVGSIKRIFMDDKSEQVTHFLISEGWIFKEERLVPLDWVKTVTDNEVQLYVKTDLLNRLPAYQT